jgi:hypothetical protein
METLKGDGLLICEPANRMRGNGLAPPRQQLSISSNRLSPVGFKAIDEMVRYFTKTLLTRNVFVRVTCFGLYL